MVSTYHILLLYITVKYLAGTLCSRKRRRRRQYLPHIPLLRGYAGRYSGTTSICQRRRTYTSMSMLKRTLHHVAFA